MFDGEFFVGPGRFTKAYARYIHSEMASFLPTHITARHQIPLIPLKSTFIESFSLIPLIITTPIVALKPVCRGNPETQHPTRMDLN